MIENSTKAKLAEGGRVFGCFVRSPDATLAEFVATADWDFLVFDGEHGHVAPNQVGDLARACDVRGVTPIARVSSNEPSLILRCLDAGAAGVHVPWVNSADEAEAAVRAVKYGPRGLRGLAGNRSTDWLANSEATAIANDQTLTVIHIETAEAAANVEQFLEIEDLDVLFIGPTDLSHSLGVPGERSHPRMVETIKEVADAVAGSDKVLGIYAGNPDAVAAGLEVGARYFTTGVETLLRPAMSAYLTSAGRLA